MDGKQITNYKQYLTVINQTLDNFLMNSGLLTRYHTNVRSNKFYNLIKHTETLGD